MLDWLFKKPARADAAPAATPAPAPDKQATARAAAGQARSEGLARVTAAGTDEETLLALARTEPLWEVKLAAVEALQTEPALKRAERELRGQDSRAHRAAKRRWQMQVSQREAHEQAQALIATATSLAQEAPLAANRLVALDQGWQAIDATGLSTELQADFAARRAQLNAVLHAQAEQAQRLAQERQRQIEEARQAETLALAQREAAQAAEAEALAAAAAVQAAIDASAPVPPPAPAPRPVLGAEQQAEVDTLLSQADDALAEGRSADLRAHLQAIDTTLEAAGQAALSGRRQTRHQALRAEMARLSAWQRWGGAHALDRLVTEAQALAQQALDAAARPDAPKLKLQAHADAIRDLRQRWKTLERSGAAHPHALWQRFDSALQTAYLPVAAQQEATKAARQDNLAARTALLDALDAVAIDPPTGEDALAAHWKEQLRVLQATQQAWRQLGPVEHTVPAAERGTVQQRWRESLARVEAPLAAARRSAAAAREALIARAQALQPDNPAQPLPRDAAQQVRALQGEWQQHARALPLSRQTETALWARFKACTDAVFAHREAAHQARESAWAAQLEVRESLLTQLQALLSEGRTPSEWQRALAQLDAAWRNAPDGPRQAMPALEARYREARAAVLQAIDAQARQRWNRRCDALAAKLALCEAREAGHGEPADQDTRWAALEALPAEWETALAQRFAQPLDAPGPLSAAACDDTLLRLEAAWQLAPKPAQEAARRALKLQALKDALESRSPQGDTAARPAADWRALLRQHRLAPAQQERFQALASALRQLGPEQAGTGRD